MDKSFQKLFTDSSRSDKITDLAGVSMTFKKLKIAIIKSQFQTFQGKEK